MCGRTWKVNADLGGYSRSGGVDKGLDLLTLETVSPNTCEHCSVTTATRLGALQKELFQATWPIKVKY